MLKVSKFGLAGGVLWGAMMFICTVLSIYTGYADTFLLAMKSCYPGYSLTWGGAFLGLIYGFIDGFVGLAILAWLYNKFCGNSK
ncbi:MAG: bacteriophage holin [Simkaniaceae bacterium]|nr:MAG: bacteriophage holin [Simkaniaceae bacterium]